MKLAPYVEKLNGSQEFKDFTKKNNDAFMMAGFFILDLESGKNLHQIDYYVPSKKKVAAFTLDKGVTFQLLDSMSKKKPEKLEIKTQIDLDALHGILEDEMKNRSITEEVKKIIAVLQTIDGKKIWNINCLLSGMGILRAHIEDDSKSVLKMEKASILDYVKNVPASALQAGQLQMQQPQQQGQAGNTSADKLKQLEKLSQAIEEEKKRISAASKPDKTEKPSKQTKKTK